jgi:hypothetical protein
MPEMYLQIVEEMKALGIPFAENAWTTRPNSSDYGVIANDFENEADDGENRKLERSWSCSVDLFSRDKRGDGIPEQIEAILDEYCGSSWEASGPKWEHETRLFHFEWTFDVDSEEV